MLGISPLAKSALAAISRGDAAASAKGSATVSGVGLTLKRFSGASSGASTALGSFNANIARVGASFGTTTIAAVAVAAKPASGEAQGASNAFGLLDNFFSYGFSEGRSEATAVSAFFNTAVLVGSVSGTGYTNFYTRQGGVGNLPVWRVGGPISTQPLSYRAFSASGYTGDNEVAFDATEEQDVVSFRIFNEAWYGQGGPGGAWTGVSPAEPDWTAATPVLEDVWENRD